jgi:nicotinate phosphoribosyltransferase
LRVDSGDNRHELQRIVEKYQSLGIDSRTKQVIFSNALTTDDAIAIQQYAKELCSHRMASARISPTTSRGCSP